MPLPVDTGGPARRSRLSHFLPRKTTQSNDLQAATEKRLPSAEALSLFLFFLACRLLTTTGIHLCLDAVIISPGGLANIYVFISVEIQCGN